MIYLACIVNNVVVDELVSQGARASVAIVLPWSSRDIPVGHIIRVKQHYKAHHRMTSKLRLLDKIVQLSTSRLK